MSKQAETVRPFSVPDATGPLPRSPGYLLKRMLLGPPLETTQLAHERLGKPTALAVFASDNLSSVAYATEEILAASAVIGFAAFSLVMPITVGILVVLAILLFSYRQTIKAYPTAGGAYVVTKDNFGLLSAQVAGVALLTDYVLTVAVSVAAGVAAIYSAAHALYPYRVPLSVFFVWFIAWGNLRGVRESGRMFAVPTYFFIMMMFTVLGLGLFRFATGTLHPATPPPDFTRTVGSVSVFLVLHAFASGGAAVTGVEAISNGVPAFKPPEWKNARTTLMWMGSTLGVMFLGLSFLDSKLHIGPTKTQTVISQVGAAIFGTHTLGHVLYYCLQVATTLILILAANTSFADFPRLASFAARDSFMPKQLQKRGHRLVFSNGIIFLAVMATGLILLFQASVEHLIPLYAIGVFTSFTLSQSGMARHHLRLREEGWRRGLIINGVGAVTTGIVTIVIAITKFVHGAWAVMVFVPIMVLVLVRMNRRYTREHAELEEDLPKFQRESGRRTQAIVLVSQLDHKTIHALQYARTIRALTPAAIHLETDPAVSRALRQQWEELGIDVPLKIVKCTGEVSACLAGFVGSLPDDLDITVIIPGPARLTMRQRWSQGRTGAKLTRALLPYENARVTIIRDHPGPERAVTEPEHGTRRLLSPRARHKVIVLVDRIDRASLAAVRYGLSLGTNEVTAVHAAVDPDYQSELIERWTSLGVPIPIEVVASWDRDVARSLEKYVAGRMDENSEITVVLPRRDYALVRHRLLHDRTSRSIARALGRYPHIDVTVVPYFFGRHAQPHGPAPSAPAEAPV
jgi:amino acid transporter